MNPITIGIDIAKQKFDVAFCQANQKWQHSSFNNTYHGYEDFLDWVETKNVQSIHAVMEATGKYGEDLAEFLYNKGHMVSILNPSQIKAYSRSLLTRNKTDQLDARILAEFGKRHSLQKWEPPSKEKKKLKEMVRCLDSFKQDRTQTLNRLAEAKDPTIIGFLKSRLKHINVQISKLESCVEILVKDTDLLEQLTSLLTSIPGIGKTTAWGLLGELPNLQNFCSAKQLSAYAGLNPCMRFSGSSVRGKSRLSKAGASHLRKLLYLPAMAAMRFNPIVKEFAINLKNKGKRPMVVVGACMRKLLHIIFGVIKSQHSFQVTVPLITHQFLKKG